MPKTVAFLGPEGTYTDEACYLYAPEENRMPFGSLGLVTNALEEGKGIYTWTTFVIYIVHLHI